MNKFATKVGALLAAVAVAGALSACGGSSSSPGSNSASTVGGSTTATTSTPKIYAIFKDTSNPYWIEAASGATAAKAELQGKADVTVTAGTSETAAASEIAKVQNAITSGANAIVIAPTVPSELKPVLTQAQQKGIKVVVVDTAIPGLDATFVGTANVQAGRLQGAYVGRLIGGQGKVAIITGPAGITPLDQRLTGFMAGKPKGVSVVSVIRTPDVNEAEGVAAAQNLITAHPDLAAIVTLGGAPAVGAAQAIKAAGKTGAIKLVGLDGNPLEAENIQAGLEDATVAQFPKKMGKVGVETALTLVQGGSAPSSIATGQQVITKQNVAQYVAQNLK